MSKFEIKTIRDIENLERSIEDSLPKVPCGVGYITIGGSLVLNDASLTPDEAIRFVKALAAFYLTEEG